MAAKARAAIILRRGPARWTHLISWDTARDTFEDGAWFRGRIYEQKCDLSPDGKLFLYAAHQGNKLASSYTQSWTAVSHAPWLHALGLWAMGTTYGGGGRFLENRKMILRGGHTIKNAHPDHRARGLSIEANESRARIPLHASDGEIQNAEWSGRDQNERRVFTRNGCVFARVSGNDRKLADFADLEPDPQPAPEWAQRSLK